MRRFAGMRTRSMMLVAILAAAAPSLSRRQYFGRNKVQYQTFDFRILRPQHFDMHFYPAESLATCRRRTHGRALVRATLGHHPAHLQPQVARLLRRPSRLRADERHRRLHRSEHGRCHGGARNRVVMPFTGIYAENDHVLGHEMVHVFQYNIAENPTSGGLQRLNQLPLWLIEGMAEYFSLGRDDPLTAMWMRDAALATTSRRSSSSRPTRASSRTATARRCGRTSADGGAIGRERRVPHVAARRVGRGIRRVLGISSDSLSKDWLASIRAHLPAAAWKAARKPDPRGRTAARASGRSRAT